MQGKHKETKNVSQAVMETGGLEGKFIFNWARNCYESQAKVKVSGHKQSNVLAAPILRTLKKAVVCQRLPRDQQPLRLYQILLFQAQRMVKHLSLKGAKHTNKAQAQNKTDH